MLMLIFSQLNERGDPGLLASATRDRKSAMPNRLQLLFLALRVDKSIFGRRRTLKDASGSCVCHGIWC